MTQDAKSFDIVVVGGGMVGMAFVGLLRQSGLKIAIIEAHKNDFKWSKGSHDQRVSAITHSSETILRKINAWQSVVQLGAYPYQKMQVWDAQGEGKVGFSAREHAQINLGHIIENRHIQKGLYQAIESIETLSWFAPFRLNKMEKHPESYRLTDELGEQITTRLLIGADGANSWVRQQASITLTQWDYHQTALVCVIKTQKHHQYCCWQQFMKTGPLAFLPLDEHYISIVWSTTPEQAKQLMALDENSFCQTLRQTMQEDFGDITLASKVAGFPLKLRHVQQYVQDNLALMGDAIHTVHPLAGQGVNLGFMDAWCLANTIMDCQQKGRDFSKLYSLRRYERERKGKNMLMLAAMDAFKRGFGSEQVLIKSLRNFGLNQVDEQQWLKRFFVQYALGESL